MSYLQFDIIKNVIFQNFNKWEEFEKWENKLSKYSLSN